jgi:alpha-beta hydrolase superfamily lysophospholipase
MTPDPILDHPVISERYFFPRPTPLPNPVMVEVPGARLGCWRSAPPSDRPVLLHFHGNGEVVADWTELLTGAVQRMGFEVFFGEYRGYGASTGTPMLGAMLDDVSAIIEAVGVAPERIVVFGRSVGSIYAIEAVHRFGSMRGLILESGIHDVLERLALRLHPDELGCTAAELQHAVSRRLDHQAKLSGYTGPCLVLHAEQDHLVGVQHAIANHRAVASENKRLVRFPQGDHNSIMGANMQAYMTELSRFLVGLSS